LKLQRKNCTTVNSVADNQSPRELAPRELAPRELAWSRVARERLEVSERGFTFTPGGNNH
jgi:hypothetical protein